MANSCLYLTTHNRMVGRYIDRSVFGIMAFPYNCPYITYPEIAHLQVVHRIRYIASEFWDCLSPLKEQLRSVHVSVIRTYWQVSGVKKLD